MDSQWSRKKLAIETELEILQRETFSHFVHETNPVNGLVIDKWVFPSIVTSDSPLS